MKGFPSLISILLSVFIIGIAPFARRILRLIYSIIGRETASYFFKIAFLFGIIALIVYIFFKKEKIKISLSSSLPLLTFIPFTILLFKIKLPEEKVHLIEYAILGFLLFKDYINKRIRLFFSILFLIFVASLDELFQAVLPDRIFDYRDIIFNFVGGFTGLSFGKFLIKVKDEYNLNSGE